MIKKRLAKLSAMAIAAVVLATSSVPASAANTENSSWTFGTPGVYTFTPARKKTNTSSVYVKVNSGQPGAYIKTYGGKEESDGITTWLNWTQYVDHVTANPGVASSIHNLIYENGCRHAKLYGRAVSPTKTTTIVWSPDSTRNYTFLN